MGTGWDGVETGLGTPNRRSGSASSAAGRAQSSREAHLSAPVTPPPAAFSETTGDFNVSYYIASDDPPAPMAAVNVTAFTRAAVFYVASWTGGPGSGAEGTVLGKARWLAEQLHKCARELGGGVGGGGAVEAATAGAHCTPRPPPPGPSGTAAASTAAPPGPCPTPLHPPCSTSTTRWPLWRRKAARRAATRWAAGQRLGRRRADREYLTGFHKRRKERQRVAAEDLRRKEKLARQKARLEVRGPHGIGQGLRSWRI